MKVLLTTLNAKYIHSNLAIRYLRAFCRQEFPRISLREFTINDRVLDIAGEIYNEKAEVVAFSCYIWNIEMILEVASILKKVSPNTTIVLGGPEVSYDPTEILEKHNYIDYVVFGEGEETFRDFLRFSTGNGRAAQIDGLGYRSEGKAIKNNERKLIKELDIIPYPYDNLDEFKNKIVYYESNRGCPFNCQYCLSSTIEGVRYFSLERVKEELKKFILAGVKQVKFVDRTFNCNNKRALEIMKFIAGQKGSTNFHFEVASDLMDKEMLDFLATVPAGLFQFEIGVQSTNTATLDIIKRRADMTKLRQNVLAIGENTKIHQHLDLIAGLPGESYDSFKKSFNEVLELNPDVLQLGFLKLLKGSGVREMAEIYGYEYTVRPPYEVLQNKDITYEEILTLKKIEEILERYGNSGWFPHSIKFLAKGFNSPFDMYEALARFWEERGFFRISHNINALFDNLFEFYKINFRDNQSYFMDLLKFDYLLYNNTSNLPPFMKRTEGGNFKEKCWDFLKVENNLKLFLSHQQGNPPKQIIKTVHFELFDYDIPEKNVTGLGAGIINSKETVILFDYNGRETKYHRIKL